MSALPILALSVAFATPPATRLGEDEGAGIHVPHDAPAPIINGDDADEDVYPMAGATLVDATMGPYPYKALVCSSTLIAPDTVLLAAHCVDPETLSQMAMGMDVNVNAFYWSRQADLTDWDGTKFVSEFPEDAIEIPMDDDHVVWHEDFSITGMDLGVAQNHDIALVFLSETASTQWAYLPTADEATQIERDVEVDVVGWGQQIATGFNEAPPSGSYAEKQVGTSFIAELGTHEFQVGAQEDDVRKCHGDSGGPSFWHATTDAQESLRVIGVTSHSYDYSDCNEKGGVDTRVDAYLEWIDAAMRERCESGSRVWCEQPGIPVLPYDVDEDGIVDWQDEKIKKGACSSTSADASLALAFLGLGALAARRRGKTAA